MAQRGQISAGRDADVDRRRAPAPKARSTVIEYSPDGKTLATRAWDGAVKLWDAHNGKERATLVPAEVKKAKLLPLLTPRLSFSPDGNSLLVQGLTGPRMNASVSLWDVATAAETLSGKSLEVKSLHDLAFSADGKSQALCVVTDKGASIVLRDPANGKQRVLADLGPAPLDAKVEKDLVVVISVKLAFSADGKRLLASIRETGDSLVKVWDLTSDKLLAEKVGTNPRLTADGTAVIVSRSGGVKVHELSGDVRQAVLERHMAIAPDGGTFFSMSKEGTMTLWETSKEGKRTVLTLDSHGK